MDEKSARMKDVVMVVYAYNPIANQGISNNPWIFDVYEDHDEGFNDMEKMQASEDYGHLLWGNNLVKLKKRKTDETKR